MQHNIFRTYESIITEDHAEELDEALLSNLGVKMKIATTKDHTKLPGLLRLLKQKGEDQKGMDGWTKIASNRHKKLSGKEMETAPKPLPKTKEQSTPVQPKATEPTSTRESEKPRKRATPQNYSTHSKNEKDTVSSSPDGDDYTIRDKFTLNKYSSERLDDADAHLQKLRDGDTSHKDTEHNIRSIVFNALHRNIEPKHHEHIRHYVNGNHDKYNSQIKAALDKGSKTVSKAIGVILNMRDTGLESEPKNEGFNPAYLMQMSESRKQHLQMEATGRLYPTNWPLGSKIDNSEEGESTPKTKPKRVVKRAAKKTRKAFAVKPEVQMARKSIANLLRYSKPMEVDDAKKSLTNAFARNPRLNNKSNPIAHELIRRQVDPEHHEHIPYYLGGSHLDIPNETKGTLNMAARVAVKQIDKFNQSEYGTRNIDTTKVTNRFM